MNRDQAAKIYAAALAAITNTRPDLPVDERARLADAVERTLAERGLIEPASLRNSAN